MTLAEKLADVVVGAKAQNVTIVGGTQFYWVVSYTLAGVDCTAELLKREPVRV